MKIPKNIKESIIKTAKYSAMATKHNNVVREWLEKNDLANGGNIDQLIDNCELTNCPDIFIKHIENEAFEGNEKEYEQY